MSDELTEETRQNLTFPRYSAYRDTGVEWLGDIPEHWVTRKLKYVAPLINDKNKGKPDGKIYLGLENVESGTGRLILDSPTEIVESVISSFTSGDVLFGKLRPYLAKVVLADFEGVCTGELLVLRPQNDLVCGKFIYYLLISHGFINTINAFTYGAKMPRANPCDIGNSLMPIPNLGEQQTIMTYLDREIGRIDELILQKKRMIDLLEKKRVALISRVVTRGLNPDAPLKDSGIEWLGEMPAHWNVTKVKYGYDIQLGKMLRPEPATKDDTLEPYLRTANVSWDGIDISDIKEMWFSPSEKPQYQLSYGDLIVCEGGDVGRASLWKEELPCCYIQNAVHRVRAKKKHDILFLYYWLFTLKQDGYIDLICSKATIAHFTAEKFQRLELILPPQSEQKEIVEYLNRVTVRIKAIITPIEESIHLLEQQRTALISAAVTGKIDVRQLVSK